MRFHPPRADDARRLAWLLDRLGEPFRVGYVLTSGEAALPFGDRVTAVPLSALLNNRPVDGPSAS